MSYTAKEHSPEECKRLYEENDDFHEYIDKYIRESGKTKDKVFREKIIRTDIASMYEQKGDK